MLKTCKIARNTYIFFNYFNRGCSNRPNVASHVLIATNVSEYIYDLEVKVQIQIFLKICLTALNTNSLFMH